MKLSHIRLFNVSVVLLGLGCVAAFIAAVFPNLRQEMRKKFYPPSRKILSTATGDLLGDGKKIKVVKVKNGQDLFLEIYGIENDGIYPLMGRIQLPYSRDGYFQFRGEVTNLALDDVDGNNTLEILAPTFDDNLTAHLNIYTYNQIEQQFELFRDN